MITKFKYRGNMSVIFLRTYKLFARQILLGYSSMTASISTSTILAANKSALDFTLADAVKDDVNYRLIRTSTEDGVLLNKDKLSNNFEINRDLPTKVFIHGWNSKGISQWYAPLKNEYLAKNPHNIIYVDWSKAGNKAYNVSAANTKLVGGYIADILVASGVKLDKIHVIGHSLGSHVAGFIGKHIFAKTGKKLYRVTATDPAAPTFERAHDDKTGRLSEGDASFVDIIHTDIGRYGYSKPIGHVDFYPNGGSKQPGCPPEKEFETYCSHRKSSAYFVKSVNTNITATRCISWDALLKGECDTREEIIFGENTNLEARGMFYVKIEANINDYI